MSWVATAIVGSAVIGAGAGMYGSSKAAKASKKGADAAAGVQQYMYDQTREDMAPYRTVGESALGRLAGMYGLSVPGSEDPAMQPFEAQGRINDEGTVQNLFQQVLGRRAEPTAVEYYMGADIGEALNEMRNSVEYRTKKDQGSLPDREMGLSPAQQGAQGGTGKNDFSAFYDSPDYQFALEEGTRATKQGMAAHGISGGRAAKELTRFGQGLASQQLNNYTNRLSALAGVGQTATNQLSSYGQNTANQIGSARRDAADARASGYLGASSAINSGIEQGYGMFAMNKMMKQGAS